MNCKTKYCWSILMIISLCLSYGSLIAAEQIEINKTAKPVIKLDNKAIKNIENVGKVTMLSDAEYQKKLRAHNLKANPTVVKRRAQANTRLASQNNRFKGPYDCDDGNRAVKPGAVEACDGIDNDCDGDVDENVTSPFYLDADSDRWGDGSRKLLACSNPDGYSARKGDCNDRSSSIHPGAEDIANNGIDENCDGTK